MKIISIHYFVIWVFAFCGFCHARDPDWFQKRMLLLDSVEQMEDSDQKFEALGRFIRVAGTNLDSEQEAVFKRAQKDLLALPGHAKYFQAKFEKSRALLIQDHSTGFQYWEAQAEIFPILAGLPSPETVGVLGTFLNDPEGRDGKTLEGGPIVDFDYQLPVNCRSAAGALATLPIENGPKVKASLFGFEQADAWKDWWNEVKAGKRTYRFIGSPIEYGPDGPVAAKERPNREHDRTEGKTFNEGGKSGEASVVASSSWPKIAAWIAVAVLAVGGWFAFGRRKAA